MLPLGTPASRHPHVRRSTASSSTSLAFDWEGPPAPSNLSSLNPGEGGGELQPRVEADRRAPDVGTALQVRGALALEANEQYPLLEQSATGSTTLSEWLSGADMPARASFQDPPTGVCVHVYSQGACLDGGITQSTYTCM